MSKYFDADKDGKLNEQEKANAMKALKEGFEDKFVWGIEQSGAHSMHRILQKRGQVVHGENFAIVGKSYPPHPISANVPRFKSKSDMEARRKQQLANDLYESKKKFDEENPAHIIQKPALPEFYVENPKHKSQKEFKEEKRKVERVKCGLTEEPVDIKDGSKDPGLGFTKNPKIKTQKELQEERKRQIFEDFKKTEAKQGNHIDAMQRLKEREDCHLRQAYKQEGHRKTQKQIEEQRKKEMLDYNMKTFGKVAIGVHGKELPKFS